ncbi:MAG: DUF58 domain-containing protein [Anaerolineae bacterium]|nr:DUF58 domain-containing protein [Anaerolineae bacterium]
MTNPQAPDSNPSPPAGSPRFDSAFLRRLEALTLITRQARSGQWQGERRSLKRGQSVEFADYRNYVPGDDFRLVDWNAYARLERFFLKLFVEEEEQTLHLLIDTSRSMAWPPDNEATNKLAYAAHAAAALGYIALAGLDRVTIATVDAALSQTLRPHRGRQQAFSLFDFLAGLQATGRTNLNEGLTQYARQSRQPGPLLIFSDLLDSTPPPSNPQSPISNLQSPPSQPPWANGVLALLARRFEITFIHLLSPDEANPTLSGDLRLLDAETGQTVEITADYESLARYQAGLAAWQAELRTWCAQRSIIYVPVTTDVPFETLIFTFLRQRGVLA